MGSKRNIAVVLAKHDRKVALAIAKRETGQQLTRHERYLLAFEDAQMTPEQAAKILAEVANGQHERGAGHRVQAINAMAQLCGDAAPKQIDVNVNVSETLASALEELSATDAEFTVHDE